MTIENKIVDKETLYADKKTIICMGIIIFCLQFTDLKIVNVKISELALLAMSPFLFLQTFRVPRYIFAFLTFFTLLLIKTLIQNFSTRFYINAALPLLKQPYILSVARFAELFCCVTFAFFVSSFFKRLTKERVLELLENILKFQIYIIGSFFFLMYLLYRVHILSLVGENGFLVYDSTPAAGEISFRLRGFFNEGGPFGLFYSYLYILYDWILKQRKRSDLLGKLLIILVVILAASKAGYCLIIIILASKAYSWAGSSRYAVILKRLVLPIAFIGAAFLLYIVASVYIERSAYLKEVGFDLKSSDAVDPNSVMGRVSGMTIAPNIIMNNYIFGIGLGNYPLVRNNPLYLDYFPEVSVDNWDSAGLGGLVDLTMDGGLIFVVFFVGIFYKLYKKIKATDVQLYPLLASFILPFCFGVQLYFLYPWFSLGIIVFFIQNKPEKPIITSSLS